MDKKVVRKEEADSELQLYRRNHKSLDASE
jgi:hypothetical protein